MTEYEKGYQDGWKACEARFKVQPRTSPHRLAIETAFRGKTVWKYSELQKFLGCSNTRTRQLVKQMIEEGLLREQKAPSKFGFVTYIHKA